MIDAMRLTAAATVTAWSAAALFMTVATPVAAARPSDPGVVSYAVLPMGELGNTHRFTLGARF